MHRDCLSVQVLLVLFLLIVFICYSAFVSFVFNSFALIRFVAKALDPPNPLAVTQALDLLVSLHCLTPEGEALTPLGEVVAQLPLPPRMAKMLLLGCLVRLCVWRVSPWQQQ